MCSPLACRDALWTSWVLNGFGDLEMTIFIGWHLRLMSKVTEGTQTDGFIWFTVWEESRHPLKTSLLLMELLPVLKENHLCNWSWRHHLVQASSCVKKNKHSSTSVCHTEIYWMLWLSDLQTEAAGFIWLHHAQAEAFMAMLLWSARVFAFVQGTCCWAGGDGWLWLCSLYQVPEWTKCSSREKRKEKKADKPFYSDSEGESGPTESADSGNSRGWWSCWSHRGTITFTSFC